MANKEEGMPGSAFLVGEEEIREALVTSGVNPDEWPQDEWEKLLADIQIKKTWLKNNGEGVICIKPACPIFILDGNGRFLRQVGSVCKGIFSERKYFAPALTPLHDFSIGVDQGILQTEVTRFLRENLGFETAPRMMVHLLEGKQIMRPSRALRGLRTLYRFWPLRVKFADASQLQTQLSRSALAIPYLLEEHFTALYELEDPQFVFEDGGKKGSGIYNVFSWSELPDNWLELI